MLVGSGGVVLFTASTNALVGYRYYADYNATKAGVVALTRSLALEWAPPCGSTPCAPATC